MLNLFKRSTTKHDRHEAGGCGCESRHARGEALNVAVPADEGCCSDRGAKAADERPAAETDRELASHHAHDSCCGGHSATAPAGQPTVRAPDR